MSLKLFLNYFSFYFGTFPCYMFHEVTHWIFAFITCILGFNTFPTIIIERWYKVEQNETGFKTVVPFYSYCTYGVFDVKYVKYIAGLCAFTPIIGLIFLLWISPWYLYFYYFSQIDTLWMSVGDTREFKALFNLKTEKL